MKRKVLQSKGKTSKKQQQVNILCKSSKISRKVSEKHSKKFQRKNNNTIQIDQRCCTSRLFQQINKIKGKLAMITDCQILPKKSEHIIAKSLRPKSQRSQNMKESKNCDFCMVNQYSGVKGGIKQRSCNSAFQFSSEKKPSEHCKKRDKNENSKKFKSFNIGNKFQYQNEQSVLLKTETDNDFKKYKVRGISSFNVNRNQYGKSLNIYGTYEKSEQDSQYYDQYQLKQRNESKNQYNQLNFQKGIGKKRRHCQIKYRQPNKNFKSLSKNQSSNQKTEQRITKQQKLKYKQQLKRLEQMNRKLLDDNKQLQIQLNYQSQQKKLLLRKIKYSGTQETPTEQPKKENKGQSMSKNRQDKRYQKYLNTQIASNSNNMNLKQSLQAQSEYIKQLRKLQYRTEKDIVIQLSQKKNNFIQVPIFNQNAAIQTDKNTRGQNFTRSVFDDSLITNGPYLNIHYNSSITQESTHQKKHKAINLFETKKKKRNYIQQTKNIAKSVFSQNQPNFSKVTQKRNYNQNDLLLPSDFPLDTQTKTLRQNNIDLSLKKKSQIKSQKKPFSYINSQTNNKQNQKSWTAYAERTGKVIKNDRNLKDHDAQFLKVPSIFDIQPCNKQSYQSRQSQNELKLQRLLRIDSYNDSQSAKTQSILLDESYERQLPGFQQSNRSQQQNILRDNKNRLERLQKYFNELISFNRLEKQMSKKMEIRKELSEIAKQIHHLKNNIIV